MNEEIIETKVRERKVVKISRWKFIVISIIVVISLIVLGLLSVVSSPFRDSGEMNYVNSVLPTSGDYNESSSNTKMISPDYYDYNNGGQPSITDTREFLKTNYSASIKTRDVDDVIDNIENIVKGADGRIDRLQTSEKSGSISFVIPKSKFDAFKDQVEKITHKKLYSENISSQNLLGQKQNIEEQTSNITNTLVNLKEQKKNLDSLHAKKITQINSSIASIKVQLAQVRASLSIATNPTVISSLQKEENSLIALDSSEKQKLSVENSSYNNQVRILESQITNAEQSLVNVNKKDSNFTDNIETVNGYVSARWVSVWELVVIFSPIHPTLIIVILIIGIWYYLKRKNYIPKIVLE